MIVIKFNKKLYNPRVIKSAVKLHKDTADFIFAEKNNYIELTLKNVDKEVEKVIKDEFCNYVLFLTQSKK